MIFAVLDHRLNRHNGDSFYQYANLNVCRWWSLGGLVTKWVDENGDFRRFLSLYVRNRNALLNVLSLLF